MDNLQNFYEKYVYQRNLYIPCSEKVFKKIDILLDDIKKYIENSFIGNKIENYELIQQNAMLNNDYERRKKNS